MQARQANTYHRQAGNCGQRNQRNKQDIVPPRVSTGQRLIGDDGYARYRKEHEEQNLKKPVTKRNMAGDSSADDDRGL